MASAAPDSNSTYDHFFPLLRTYLTLHLRATQKLNIIHARLQHNRYANWIHGPPYERLEHWNRIFSLAQEEYDAIQLLWRERQDGLDAGFEERVRKGIESLGRALDECTIADEEGESR